MCFIQAIVYMLVNKVMEQMTATVVEELFNDQAVVEMLAEDAGFTVIDIWDDADARGTEWVNGLFRKGPAPLDEG